MKVNRIMVKAEDLVTIDSSKTVFDAITKMSEKNVGSILIKENDKITGILTNKDVMESIVKDKSSAFDMNLSEFITSDLISVSENDEVNNAIKVLKNAKTHHLMVHNDKSEIIGIFSSYDIVRERALDLDAFPWIRSWF